MQANNTEIETPVTKPLCDFCKTYDKVQTLALYDGKTWQGPWAYMCQVHFEVYGVGLGLGRGQKFVTTK